MKFELENFNRNVSDEELLNDLMRVAAEIGKKKVTIDEYNDRGRYHSTTLTRRFGSWFTCLEKAGLEKTRSAINIPNEELFENIRDVWIKLGRQPKYKDLTPQISKYSAGTYEKRFGSWRKALERFIDYCNSENDESNQDKDVREIMRHVEVNRSTRSINWRLRFLVLRRDNFKCKACGASPARNPDIELQVDHIFPWSKGGATVMENLQTLCSVCNIGKSDLFEE